MHSRIKYPLVVVLFLFGFLACFSLAALVISARLNGIFTTIVSDSPTTPFEKLACPYYVKQGDKAPMSVILQNSGGETLIYSMAAISDGFVISHLPAALSIPGGQMAELSWTVTAVVAGLQAVAIEARSNVDAALPGTIHPWPTSYREGCGILVIPGPFSGRLVIILGLASALIGSAFLLSGSLKRIRNPPAE